MANSKFDDLCFCINWFDDISIIRCLDSLPKAAHKLVIDGKYKEFDAPNDLSHPLLRKEVLLFDNVILFETPNLTEIEKRNIYLDNCRQKYAFIIDSDEYIKYVDWEKLFVAITPLHTDLRAIWIKDHTQEGKYLIPPRIVVNPNEWEYYKAHWIFRRKNTGYIPRVTESMVWLDLDIIELNHTHDIRDKNYMKSHDKYNVFLGKQEAEPKRQYFDNELR